jgi:hypothetical protein
VVVPWEPKAKGDERQHIGKVDNEAEYPWRTKWSSHMDEFSTTSDTLDQAEEEILTPTLSDEALEAALRGPLATGYTAPGCNHGPYNTVVTCC